MDNKGKNFDIEQQQYKYQVFHKRNGKDWVFEKKRVGRRVVKEWEPPTNQTGKGSL